MSRARRCRASRASRPSSFVARGRHRRPSLVMGVVREVLRFTSHNSRKSPSERPSLVMGVVREVLRFTSHNSRKSPSERPSLDLAQAPFTCIRTRWRSSFPNYDSEKSPSRLAPHRRAARSRVRARERAFARAMRRTPNGNGSVTNLQGTSPSNVDGAWRRDVTTRSRARAKTVARARARVLEARTRSERGANASERERRRRTNGE